MKNSTTTLISAMLLFAITSTLTRANEPALTLESDWLDSRIGSSGNILGAKIINVVNDPGSNITVIDIMLPLDNLDNYEQVEVIGKTSQQPIKQRRSAEWIKNYDNDSYGLRLHLKKEPGFEFRLRLIDSEPGSKSSKNP
ncbi:MAG: hypothetical protein H8D34_28775 [Chloroflexi bacterium]|nr:hypothetical protein [Chloroflexota bacterium]